MTDPRDAYDIGDTVVGPKASANPESPPLSEPGDGEEWEPDQIVGHIHGVGGQYHVRFPTTFPASSMGGDPHGLVALAVNESLHGKTSFTGLYVRSDKSNFALTRYVSNDDKTKGKSTDEGIGEFLNDNDVVWVKDEAVEGVDVPTTLADKVEVGDLVDWHKGDGTTQECIVTDVVHDGEKTGYVDLLRANGDELTEVLSVPPKGVCMSNGYTLPEDDEDDSDGADA